SVNPSSGAPGLVQLVRSASKPSAASARAASRQRPQPIPLGYRSLLIGRPAQTEQLGGATDSGPPPADPPRPRQSTRCPDESNGAHPRHRWSPSSHQTSG